MIAKPAAMPGTCGARKASPPAISVNSSSGHRRLTRIALGWFSGSAVLAFASASRRAIGGVITHQPTTIGNRCSSELVPTASTVTSASAVAAPALSITVDLRKSTNRTRLLQQRLEQFAHARRAVDGQVGLARQLGWRFVGIDGDAENRVQRSRLHKLAQSAKGVEVGGVVADVKGRGRLRAAQQHRDAEALVELDRRAHLEHLAPPVHHQAFLLREPCDFSHGHLGGLLVGCAAPVKRGDRVLVFAAEARTRADQAASSGSTSGRVERGRSSSPPWLPTYASVPIATIWRAVAA